MSHWLVWFFHKLEVFEVSNVEEEKTGIFEETGLERRIIHIYLSERDNRSEEQLGLRPNGFTEERMINDFPICDRKDETRGVVQGSVGRQNQGGHLSHAGSQRQRRQRTKLFRKQVNQCRSRIPQRKDERLQV